MSTGSEHPGVLHLSSALSGYLERIRELGAMEGQEGSLEINPTLKPVIEALHHVLAGGEVEVRVIRDGQQDIFQELEQRAAQATHETNAINPPPGKVVVAAV